MIIAFVIDNKQNICSFNEEFNIQLYDYNDGLPTLIKNITFIIKEEIIETLFLNHCDVIVLNKIEKEFKEEASKYKIDIWLFDNIKIQDAIDSLKNKDKGMSEHQQFVKSYELDHDFNIGFCDDDDIGGS